MGNPMTNKKLLKKVEGKRHDRKPPYRRSARQRVSDEIDKWLKENNAVESMTFDEETGRPMRTFTIDLTK